MRGHGLAGIRERVAALGGRLDVESTPGEGHGGGGHGPVRPARMAHVPDRDATFDVDLDGPVRVVLVDDHPVVRAGLRALLDGRPDEVVVVGEAVDAASARGTIRATAPDVVLMDLNLGAGPGGIAAIRALDRVDGRPRVLVLTTYQTEADVLAAMDAGAVGVPAQGRAARRAVPRGPGDGARGDGAQSRPWRR